MKKILLVLAALAAMFVASAQEDKSPQQRFNEKLKSVNLDDIVGEVYVSSNAYDQLQAVFSRVNDIKSFLVPTLVYASAYCQDSEYEDCGAECIAAVIRNVYNLKRELDILDDDLRMLAIKIRTMEVLND